MDYLTGGVDLTDPDARKQDRMILGWMYLCVSTGVLTEISGCSSSYEAWEGLREEFASSSRS